MVSTPSITVSHKDLCGLLGKQLPIDEVTRLCFRHKFEVEKVEDDTLYMDILSDRPDLLSTEGIARELKGILGIEKGLPGYAMEPSTFKVEVRQSVENIRPFISCAIVRDVDLTENALLQAMQLQEKLHGTYCRNRRAASIGIYNLDKVDDEIIYEAVGSDRIRFTPLEHSEQMTGIDILSRTSKGKEYSRLVQHLPKFPLLRDVGGQVLSMPPVVNSEDTKVEVGTKSILIDVTSMTQELADRVLCIMATNIAERRGTIQSVAVAYHNDTYTTPRLQPQTIILQPSKVSEMLGVKMAGRQIKALLEKMRYGVSGVRTLHVSVPAYRADILRDVDMVEDIAIAYGYDQFEPEFPTSMTIGQILPATNKSHHLRSIMAGFGFQEVANYVMTNTRIQRSLMREPALELIEVENPRSEEYHALRSWLTPLLLNFLAANLHISHPQKIFEYGDVVLLNKIRDNSVTYERHLAAAISDHEVGYEDIQAVVHSLLKLAGVSFLLRPIHHNSFTEGRAAEIVVRGVGVGIVGEIQPEVLLNFRLEKPVAAFEINAQPLWSAAEV